MNGNKYFFSPEEQPYRNKKKKESTGIKNNEKGGNYQYHLQKKQENMK